MKKKDSNVEIEKQLAGVETSMSKAEMFFEKNGKKMLLLALAIALAIGCVYAFIRFYQNPKEEQAQNELWKTIHYFERDSFNLALHGDGTFTGFLDIVENNGSTDAGSIASYYAGVCYLKLGQLNEAIEYLKKYDGNDRLIGGGAYGLIGDAYSDLQDYSNAKKYYKKAAEHDINELNTPYFYAKLAGVFDHEQNYSESKSLYEKILQEFPNSAEARDAQKYIARYTQLMKDGK